MNAKENDSVCAMIVTYGDRSHLCCAVVDRLVDMGVRRVVVVSNASDEHSCKKLIDAATKIPQLELIQNEENIGAGGGFSIALEAALKGDEEFLFFLDDDNLPDFSCIRILLLAHSFLCECRDELVLYANRGATRSTDRRVFTGKVSKEYKSNSFCGFSLGERVLNRINPHRENLSEPTRYPVVKVQYGPYGGMFGRREVFFKAGSPRSDFFLYADDHDYSINMSINGVSLFIVEDARIEDLDISFSPGYYLLSSRLSDMRVYYQTRNHTVLSKRFLNSRPIYNINKFSFLGWELFKGWRAWMRSPVRTFLRWRLILRAVADGEAEKLGLRKF